MKYCQRGDEESSLRELAAAFNARAVALKMLLFP